MPAQSARIHDFHTLSARLATMHEDIARQGRARPLAIVPDETARLTRRLLADTRRFISRTGQNRVLPRLGTGPVSFSALSLTLGEARLAFNAHGAALGLDRPPAGSKEAMFAAAESDLLHLISTATAGIRKNRDARR